MYKRSIFALTAVIIAAFFMLGACSADKKAETDATETQITTDGYQNILDEGSAKGIALTEAGADESSVENLTVESKEADGEQVYVVSFSFNGSDFEYTINAQSGEITEEFINGSKVVV